MIFSLFSCFGDQHPFRLPSVSNTDEFLLTLAKKDKLDDNLVLN